MDKEEELYNELRKAGWSKEKILKTVYGVFDKALLESFNKIFAEKEKKPNLNNIVNSIYENNSHKESKENQDKVNELIKGIYKVNHFETGKDKLTNSDPNRSNNLTLCLYNTIKNVVKDDDITNSRYTKGVISSIDKNLFKRLNSLPNEVSIKFNLGKNGATSSDVVLTEEQKLGLYTLGIVDSLNKIYRSSDYYSRENIVGALSKLITIFDYAIIPEDEEDYEEDSYVANDNDSGIDFDDLSEELANEKEKEQKTKDSDSIVDIMPLSQDDKNRLRKLFNDVFSLGVTIEFSYKKIEDDFYLTGMTFETTNPNITSNTRKKVTDKAKQINEIINKTYKE